jgi:hypothetical protein
MVEQGFREAQPRACETVLPCKAILLSSACATDRACKRDLLGWDEGSACQASTEFSITRRTVIPSEARNLKCLRYCRSLRFLMFSKRKEYRLARRYRYAGVAHAPRNPCSTMRSETLASPPLLGMTADGYFVGHASFSKRAFILGRPIPKSAEESPLPASHCAHHSTRPVGPANRHCP